ncbi:TorF family putative porin [Limnohabitans sp.]|uniref:TorF family putative porin n=1 Tax=Limnohabitans sp. TaxID=1907725 RepID=UPI00311E314A
MKAIATKSLVLAALIAAPLMASAQLSTNVSLVSNYKFRGQDQDLSKTTAVKPALQGGFDYAFSNGMYVGNWNSSVNWLTGNSLEMDVYGGYKGEYSGVGYDVGLLKYAYPGAASANTTEAYLGLSYGVFSAKYSTTVSDKYFGAASKVGYFSVSYAQEISKGLTLKAAVGHTNYKNNVAAAVPDFSDYSVGASYDLGDGYSVTGAVVGATKKADFTGDVNKNRFILTFTKAM